MRNPSPISTSSPRATTISRPAASAVATRASAAAQLLTTSAASAAGTAAAARRSRRRPARARARRWPGRARRRWSRPRLTASTAAGDSGARPRLVCTSDAGGVEHRPQAARGRGQRGEDRVDARPPAATSPAARPLLHALDDLLDQGAPQPPRRPAEPRRRRAGVGARHLPARDRRSPRPFCALQSTPNPSATAHGGGPVRRGPTDTPAADTSTSSGTIGIVTRAGNDGTSGGAGARAERQANVRSGGATSVPVVA